jgi:hypothetical protein
LLLRTVGPQRCVRTSDTTSPIDHSVWHEVPNALLPLCTPMISPIIIVHPIIPSPCFTSALATWPAHFSIDWRSVAPLVFIWLGRWLVLLLCLGACCSLCVSCGSFPGAGSPIVHLAWLPSFLGLTPVVFPFPSPCPLFFPSFPCVAVWSGFPPPFFPRAPAKGSS